LFAAEQDLLLVRLAADSRARRGELAVLRRSDLDGRVLTIERGVSQGVVGPTKQRRTRRLTLSAGTVAMIEHHMTGWMVRCGKPDDDWLFSPTPQRSTFLTAGALSHRFARLGAVAGVDRPALHRLRHGLATHLVDEGKLLKAQARLGHADPSTTLRHYCHAVMLDDQDVADELDRLLALDE
jgi:integrase